MNSGFGLEGGAQELPDALSQAIRDCLEDLEMCEKDRRYQINMNAWHILAANGKCNVCLGGARLARIRDNPEEDLVEGENIPRKIYAMDKVKFGQMFEAAYWFYTDTNAMEKVLEMRSALNELTKTTGTIPSYHINKKKFKKILLQAADGLEKIGL